MFTYRIDQSYEWNFEHGPTLDGPPPAVPATPMKRFLGLPVRSRLGISAGLLLNSRWIEAYGRLGFDILTYKTVRLRARACYPPPNWVFLESEGPLEDGDAPLVRRATPPDDPRDVTSSVCFGMPSKAPAEWCEDVGRARRALADGQVLIVSVVASPDPGASSAALVDEFRELATLAAGAGAHVVEANLSCPNVCTAEGQVFVDAELSGRVARALREGAPGVPLLLKAGHFPQRERLADFLRAVAGSVAGVVLVNGLSRRILEPDGTPVFGAGREVAGVIGRGIHAPCVENVRDAVEIVAAEDLDLEVTAVGGVLDEDDAARYFAAGAAAVLMGGAPMYDRELAIRMKRAHPEW